MAKLATLFILTLLLVSTLSFAARSGPAFPNESTAKTQAEGVETENTEAVEDSCEGVGEEECLMRRTLAAHIDYIYTQKQKP
ncbi:Phytosulfokine - like 1 [Theobroma cacao]|uniref:Phytosulfokine n=1 Tax=Theobroma cacao TaxID=3641 RepID=A0AB32VNA6_THECC|nr:PREDICTED: phytosulfokines 3 [Theobroma cacao]WRX08431.1 Phytosulfokine - like 1 [Theobroma cacao]